MNKVSEHGLYWLKIEQRMMTAVGSKTIGAFGTDRA